MPFECGAANTESKGLNTGVSIQRLLPLRGPFILGDTATSPKDLERQLLLDRSTSWHLGRLALGLTGGEILRISFPEAEFQGLKLNSLSSCFSGREKLVLVWRYSKIGSCGTNDGRAMRTSVLKMEIDWQTFVCNLSSAYIRTSGSTKQDAMNSPTVLQQL
ncbi:uncharacterized protein BDR25DRAFT_357881 [Lindgomyces ingoldianus]|uniref:Uncharacterized protein n=1 Tax=Lindgomyces ingoldianus TaxID=673940 RepID=A0ACB6QM97_9PLEO|nr:uncharacterized protein BDR25DRAFT_357881 [Lindgomyces ingoldianus]KAF2468134.1 hypothetical protein BDR25DRAFT_357881 [Lindgomyces ingoldianus]